MHDGPSMDDDAVQPTGTAEVDLGVAPANCVRLRARDLSIAWGNDRRYWSWVEDSTSLHSEVAKLKEVTWFDASGEINCLLSPGAYTLSWRIRLDNPRCWEYNPVHFTLSKDGMQNVDERKCFISDSFKQVEQFKVPTIRVVENGWREFDVGEFVVENGERTCQLKFAMQSFVGNKKSGISLDGIVVQPTSIARVAYETPGISVDSFRLQPSSAESVSAETLSIPDEHDSIDNQRGDVVQPTSTAEEATGITVSRCHGVTPANCIRFGARLLSFAWDVDHTSFGRFWSWVKDPTALHSVVAKLREVDPFDARGEINCLLPPGAYTLSWRIRLDKPPWFDTKPVHFTLFKDDVLVDERKCVLSKSYIRVEQFKVPTIRVVENGWREFDVGEFVVESGERICHLKFAIKGDAKYGISLDGVVVQPTSALHVESVSAETLSLASEHSRAVEWSENPIDRQGGHQTSYPDSPSATENFDKLKPQGCQRRRVNSQESHVTSCLCDPFYPYFHCLPCQSTTTVRDCSTCPAEIPVWRALVDSEVGIERCLRKSLKPSPVVESMLSVHLSLDKFLEQYGDGIRAQEQGKWEVAEYNFSELRRDIVCSVGELEKQDYDFLLACIDLPLAQLFQSRGGADMLQSAMNLRKEVLDSVMSLQGSSESLVRVCKTYFYTAQYEWGAAVMCSKTKNEAIWGYASLMSCDEGEAEAQLCFLLCVDHEYSGSSNESLRWIQEANLVWERNSPDKRNSCRIYLHYEVKMLTDFITEIGKGTAVIDNSQLAVYNGRLIELQRRLQPGLDGDKNSFLVSSGTTNPISEIPNLHDPIMTSKPCPIGSSLGLVQAYDDMELYCEEINKLPEPILQSCRQLASNAQERCDWKQKIIDYEQVRGLLKFTKRFRKVDNKTYEWLLSWFDLPLAHLYQYRAREFVQAQKVWKEMLYCAENQMGSDQAFLTHGYQIMSDAILLEQKREQHDSNWVKDDLTAAHGMCFWLYFGHYQFQNWTLALKWLREAKRLKDEFCSKEDRNCATKCSEYGYLWNDYYYLLGEADLLIHLVNESQHNREFSLLVENHEHEDRAADQMPSPTGMILQANDKLAMQSKLVQSQAGLEHHLHKLPVPFHLAFLIHGSRGCSYYDQSNWEMAIFDFEWCKEILKLVLKAESGSPEIKEACSWLMVWASLPLSNIYLFKKNQFKKAFDLQMEMERMIPSGDSDELRSLKDNLLITRFMTRYQYSISHLKNPDLKERVVRDFGVQRSNQDDKANENYLLTKIFHAFMDDGNFKAALGFIQEAKKYLSSEDVDGINQNVELEAFCHTNLGRDDLARKVIMDYRRVYKIRESQLQPRMKQMLDVYKQKIFTLDKSRDFIPRRRDRQQRIIEILRLILSDNERWNWESLEKEVQCYEESFVNPTDNKGKMKTASESDLDYGDYLLLSGLRVGLCLRTIKLLNPSQMNHDQIKAFCQDENFQRVVMYCEKCMELSPESRKSLTIARSKFFLAQLYGALDSKYHEHLLFLINKLSQTKDRNSIYNPGQQSILNAELCSYFDRELTPIQKYGKEAGAAFTSLLENTNYSEDQWLRLLEQHKQLCSLLQVYHCRRVELCEFLFHKIDRSSRIIEQRYPWQWAAFMYAEGERSQSMLYQLLGANKLNSSFTWSFDESMGYKTGIQNLHKALPPRGVFVQYSNLVEDGRAFLIYVCGGEPILDIIKCVVDSEEPRNLVNRLDDMYKFLDPTKKDLQTESSYDNDSLEKDLEFLYDLLIRPIAYHLDKMEENHSLILSPNELFTKVPFAALRNRVSGKYLIEHHTISLTPSLRVLRACTERLEELQLAPLRTDLPGSIVALGNPTYSCSKCKIVDRKSLPGTEKEVNNIAEMFRNETQVKTLLGDNATAEELVHWAKQPSETGFRQVILHIGSHGQFDKDDHRKNVLHLACDSAFGTSAKGECLPSSDRISTSRGSGSRGEPDGFDKSNDEDVWDSDDEASTMIKRNLSMSEHIFVDSISMVDSEVLNNCNSSRNRGAPLDSSNNSHGLTAEFISSLDPKWKAELVVLSACQTSRGKVTSEGVLSMARSFIIAGVPCVVASLWKVGDDATIKLMDNFYEGLRRYASVARALRFAMLHRLLGQENPTDPSIRVEDWAAFNVWGHPSLCLPRQLQSQGREGRSFYYDPSPPRLMVQDRASLRNQFFKSLSWTPKPDPVYYDELYGNRVDKPYDSIFYDPTIIARSQFAVETNSMYKWSWFKDP